MKALALGITWVACQLAGTALAVTVLTTTPIFLSNGHPIPVTCAVMNGGAKDVVLELDVMNIDGTVGHSTDPNQLLGSQVFTQIGGDVDQGWCRIIVRKGSAKGVHGTAFFQDGDSYKFALPAQ